MSSTEKDPTVENLVPKMEDVETMAVDDENSETLEVEEKLVEKPTATIEPIATVEVPSVVETMAVEEPTAVDEKPLVIRAVTPKRKRSGAKACGGARRVGRSANVSPKLNKAIVPTEKPDSKDETLLLDVNEVMKVLEKATMEKELEKLKPAAIEMPVEPAATVEQPIANTSERKISATKASGGAKGGFRSVSSRLNKTRVMMNFENGCRVIVKGTYVGKVLDRQKILDETHQFLTKIQLEDGSIIVEKNDEEIENLSEWAKQFVKIEKNVVEEIVFPDGFDPETYRKMKKMGLKSPVIKNKLVLNGYKGQEEELYRKLFLDPPKPAAAAEAGAPTFSTADAQNSTETVVYPEGFDPQKYRGMLKVKLPPSLVRDALIKDGYEAEADLILSLLQKDKRPVIIYPKGFNANKYKRMIKYGQPPGAVKNRIIQDGAVPKEDVDELYEKLKQDPNQPTKPGRPSGGLNFAAVKLRKSGARNSPAAPRAAESNVSSNARVGFDPSQIKNVQLRPASKRKLKIKKKVKAGFDPNQIKNAKLRPASKRKMNKKVEPERKGFDHNQIFTKKLRKTTGAFNATKEKKESKQNFTNFQSMLKKTGRRSDLVTNKTEDNKQVDFRSNLKKRVVKERKESKKQAVQQPPSWVRKKKKPTVEVGEDTPLEKPNNAESKMAVDEVVPTQKPVVIEETAVVEEPVTEEHAALEEADVAEEPVVLEASPVPEEVVTEELADEKAVVVEDHAVSILEEFDEVAEDVEAKPKEDGETVNKEIKVLEETLI